VFHQLKLAGVATLLAVAIPSTIRASTFSFGGPVDRSGDTNGPVQIANDFTVNAPDGINITQLGLFIDGYDGAFVTGPSATHSVSLINRTTSALVASVNISGSNINTVSTVRRPNGASCPIQNRSGTAQTPNSAR